MKDEKKKKNRWGGGTKGMKSFGSCNIVYEMK